MKNNSTNKTINTKIKNILNNSFLLKNLSAEIIHNLSSKFNTIKINDIDLATYIINNNKTQNLNLSQNQILSIIKDSDLVTKNLYERILPMEVLLNNKDQNLNLSPEQIMSILEISDLNIQDIFGTTLPMIIIDNNKYQNLKLNPNQTMSILEKSDLSIKDFNGFTILISIFHNNKKTKS